MNIITKQDRIGAVWEFEGRLYRDIGTGSIEVLPNGELIYRVRFEPVETCPCCGADLVPDEPIPVPQFNGPVYLTPYPWHGAEQ